MNWQFISDGIKPKDLEECFAIDSQERGIVLCYWCEKENLFHAHDPYHTTFYFGEYEDYDNFVVAWIPVRDVMTDYFIDKEVKFR